MMLYSDDRTEIRNYFFEVWEKNQSNMPLEFLEQQILAVILEHPEYHFIFEKKEKNLSHNFFSDLGEINPFLHFGLHLSIREQIHTNRPAGIAQLYETLLRKNNGDHHQTEHLMMDSLMDILWKAQRDGTSPDEKKYLEQLSHCTILS